ncbi:MAG TPA: ribonuclease T2 [Xanthobacteraceae bacterium]|nr:ribonuclease T2 [Xanthobacteraceae bacterium]
MRPLPIALAALALVLAAYAFQNLDRSSSVPSDPAPPATRQQTRPNPAPRADADTPGRFDYYVLSLSWSPSYCESAGDSAEPEQCGRGRPFAFVVHGLWPQFDKGWPQDCQNPAPRVPEATLRGMLDLMPSRKLVLHEWRKHGTCSGLSADDYFALVRKARAAVTIPAAYRRLDAPAMVAPNEVEAAFVTANPGLAPDMIAVDCADRRLSEVRICMTPGLELRACPDVDRRACRAPRVAMPPVRGG